MATTQRVQVGFGKAVFDTQSMTIAAFVVEPEFVRTLSSKKLDRIGATIRTPVSLYPDIDGFLYNDTLNAPEGTIIAIQTSVKQRGAGLRDGTLFIRTRQEGALYLITAHIPYNRRSTLTDHNHIVFSGFGDILTLEDLYAEGIHPTKGYISAFMEHDEVEECYTINTIRKASAAAPKVEKVINDKGAEVRISLPSTPRRMRIRKSTED